MDGSAHASAAWNSGGFNHGVDGSAAEHVPGFQFTPYPQPGAAFDGGCGNYEWGAWGPWAADGYSWPQHPGEQSGTYNRRPRYLWPTQYRSWETPGNANGAVDARAAEPAAEELPPPELTRLVTEDQVEQGVPTTWVYKFEYKDHLDYAASLAKGLGHP
jgi:hypothetical protein